MPKAGCAGVEEIEDRAGEIGGVSWGADLIVDDGQGFAGLGSLDHGAGEIGAMPAINPCGADDQPARAVGFLNRLFAEQFRSAVGTERIHGIGGQIGAAR